MFNIFNNGAIMAISFQYNNRVFPLQNIINKNDTSVALALFKLIVYFISFLLVIILAFYFTKLIAKKTTNITRSNNLQVLDFIALSSNSKIVIVNIIDNIYILSISNNQVTVIDKLSKNDVDINSLKVHYDKKSFNSYLEDILENTKKLKYKTSKLKFMQFGELIKSKHDVSEKDSQKDKE